MHRGIIGIQHSQWSQIGDEEAKQMADALAINHTLTTLDLGVRFYLIICLFPWGNK